MMLKTKSLKCMAQMPKENEHNPGTLGIVLGKEPSECNDVVFVQQKTYQELFGKKTMSDKNYFRGHIVKVSFQGRSIHRRIEIATAKNLTSDMAVLTYLSIGQLSHIDDNTGRTIRPVGEQITLSKGNRICFWHHHPNPAARIAFIIGEISILLSVISIVLTILFQFCC